MDFKSVLNQNMQLTQPMERTQASHFSFQDKFEAHTMYRNPNQASLDGNTVEANVNKLSMLKMRCSTKPACSSSITNFPG